MATGGVGVTIEELIEENHISRESLARVFTAEHAVQLSEKLSQWERLALHLGLSDPQIEAIKRDCSNEEERRIASLNKWRESFSFKATYEKMIEALLACGKAILANEICKFSIAPTQDSRSCSYPLPKPIPVTTTEKVKNIEVKFEIMVKKVEELFVQSNTCLKDLQRIASHPCNDTKAHFGIILEKGLGRIYGVKSVEELFAVLSYFWDYLQPEFLFEIVKQSQNAEVQSIVSEYEQELSSFRKIVTLNEYLGERRCNLDEEDYQHISVRLGNEWHEKTLDDLQKLRHKFADGFSLPRLVPKLYGLKSNSITVIFSFPRCIVLDHEQVYDFFTSNPYNALQITLDGVCIFDVEFQKDVHVNESSCDEDVKINDEKIQGKSPLKEMGSETSGGDLKSHGHQKTEQKTPHTESAVEWEKTIEGKQHHYAAGSRDVLIIVSSESLQGDDIVPRQNTELTKEDMKKLERLNFSRSLESCDDASIMKARYEMEKCHDLDVVSVERDEPGNRLTRQHVMTRIKGLMTATKKFGVVLRYFGPGRKNTGDWCFADGFITFRDLAELYCNYFRGHVLGITTDCSYSGSWVKELKRFLDEKQVRPCGHSTKEKKILIKVLASCKPLEIPHRRLCSIRANYNDKNTGKTLTNYSSFEVAADQHTYGLDPTEITCTASSFQEPCTTELSSWELVKDSVSQHPI